MFGGYGTGNLYPEWSGLGNVRTISIFTLLSQYSNHGEQNLMFCRWARHFERNGWRFVVDGSNGLFIETKG